MHERPSHPAHSHDFMPLFPYLIVKGMSGGLGAWPMECFLGEEKCLP